MQANSPSGAAVPLHPSKKAAYAAKTKRAEPEEKAMKGDEINMSFAIIRNQNHKVGAVGLVERHNERRNKNYSNPDIKHERSCENYHIKSPQGSYWETFNKIRDRHQLKGNLRLKGEKQSTVLCEFIITSDKSFFDRLGAERTKRFFEDAYQFVTAKVGGEQFVVAAVVHMDEATPHMHITFIPTVLGKDRKGQPCRRINCSEFWKGRDSYARLQDEWYDWIAHTCNYDLERGIKGSAAEHLSVAEYKLKKTQEQLDQTERQSQEIENIESISAKNLPLNTVALKRTDYDKLKASAEAYITTRDTADKTAAENAELHKQVDKLHEEKEALRHERDVLTDQLYNVNQSFERFYDEVGDNQVLYERNKQLTRENETIGNQVHELTDEIKALKEQYSKMSENNENLTKTVEEKTAEVVRLTGELTALQKIHKELQDKWDKVMKFIQEHRLKEQWEKYIAAPIRKKLSI